MGLTPIEKLRATRAPLISTFNIKCESLQTLIETPKPGTRQLKALIKQLTTKLDKISDITDEIAQLLDTVDEVSNESQTVDAMRDRLIELEAVETLLKHTSTVERPHETISHAKLPKMNLKPFDGDIFQWRTFWQRFESTIHQNSTLAKIDRFNYLESLLQGDAAKIIEGLPVTDETYDDAVKLLKDRFGKPDILISACMQGLLALPEIKNPSLAAFRNLVDSCSVHVRTLNSMGVTSEHYSALLSPVLLSKIPEETRLLWTKLAKVNSNNLDQLLEFLNDEVDSIQRCQSFDLAKVGVHLNTRPEAHQKSRAELRVAKREPSTIGAFSNTVTECSRSCLYCKISDHATFNCPKSISEERGFLKKDGRCFNCIKRGHRVNECPTSRSRCQNCKGLHHTSICDGTKKTEAKPECVERQPMDVSVNLTASSVDDVLLQTATIHIEGPAGIKTIRCLVDGGSQRSFITQSLASELELKRTGSEFLRIKPFGAYDGGLPKDYDVFSVNTRGTVPDSELVVINAIAVPNITTSLSTAPYRSILREIASEYSPLADLSTDVATPNSIDLLIGADQCWNVLTRSIHPTTWGPVAIGSRYGWILHGPLNFQPSSNSVDIVSMLIRTSTHPEQLDDQLITRFWNIDSIGICEPTSTKTEDEAIMQTFEKDLVYDSQRYSVSLPWKMDPSSLYDNFEICDKRLRSLLRKLQHQHQPNILEAYMKTFAEYKEAEFITEVPITFSSDTRLRRPLHYLPHHPVVRAEKISSKVRIVFDASARTVGGTSLNDHLECGPTLNLVLMKILLTFRTYKIPLMAHIENAFPQIQINEKDRDVLRFLWVQDPLNPQSDVIADRWNRLIFGMKCSPFILTATIKHHLQKEATQYPTTAAILDTSMYVDDVVAGADTVDEAVKFVTESRRIFTNAGMNLRRWITSEPDMQKRIGIEDSEESVTFHGTESTKVLGLVWKNLSDTFSFKSPTILTESMINSRPLTYLSDSPLEPSPLTPSHFLTGQRLTVIPTPSIEELPSQVTHEQLNRKKMYYASVMKRFWNRWNKEYLSELQQYRHGGSSSTPLNVGEIVFINEDNVPRLKWKLGRITAVHPGRDGNIRAATLKTSKSELIRPIQRLYRLEVMDNPSADAPIQHHAKEDPLQPAPSILEPCSGSRGEDVKKSYVSRKGRMVRKPIRFL